MVLEKAKTFETFLYNDMFYKTLIARAMERKNTLHFATICCKRASE
jgi:hypothetical protein